MTNSRMNPKVDEFLSKAEKWKKEFEKLRSIVLDCELTEDFKWMHPCYTFENKNIVLIHGFKEYCALLFHKGALLKDAHGILIQQTENVQAARQIRFTNLQEIIEMETILKAYIQEAIEVEKAGLEVNFKKNTAFIIPEELENKFEEIPELKPAFEALTPGRQKEYIFYFSKAKKSETRESRIEKNMQRILNGKGLKDCICGLSQKQPHCDGSHKHIR
ncbi:YdeI/OmpD-associated family protein [Bacillaceae bacterium Marseille-Q3522]|nr:YdeI/OmpD-associated family protein [Bacillaceae bacterium Marseille-Q3522]